MAGPWLRLLGEAVRTTRRRAGLTQAQLGHPRLSKSFVSQLEKGAVAPSVESLFHIARRLDISPVQLVGLADVHLRADTHFTMAEAALALEGPAAADAWTAPLAYWPHGPDRWRQARQHRLEGLRELAGGSPDRAAARFEDSLMLLEAAAPGSGAGEAHLTLYWLGAAHEAAGRPVTAAQTWEGLLDALGHVTVPAEVSQPVPAVGPGVAACLLGVTRLRLASLYDMMGDRAAADNARAAACTDPAAETTLQAGPVFARLLWLTALEAFQRADLAGAAACARLVPLLVSPTRWAPAPPAPPSADR